ncbi:hypothetical protein HZS_7159, partial [Henneguya salminicola]
METNENMDDIFSQSSRLVTRRRKSYTALFKLRVIEYASTANIKRASYAEVCGWISQTWTSVTNECVKHGFQKALYETGKEEAGDAEDEKKIEMTKTRVWRLMYRRCLWTSLSLLKSILMT